MKKKGFTLIELLAVIVILAIIALIATPLVLKYIDRAKEGANDTSAQSVLDASEKYYMELILTRDYDFPKTISFPDDKNELGLKGKLPDDGSVTIYGDGSIYLDIIFDDIAYTKYPNETKISKLNMVIGDYRIWSMDEGYLVGYNEKIQEQEINLKFYSFINFYELVRSYITKSPEIDASKNLEENIKLKEESGDIVRSGLPLELNKEIDKAIELYNDVEPGSMTIREFENDVYANKEYFPYIMDLYYKKEQGADLKTSEAYKMIAKDYGDSDTLIIPNYVRNEDGSLDKVLVISKSAFYRNEVIDDTRYLYCAISGIAKDDSGLPISKNLIISEGIEMIDELAFLGCHLKSVSLPRSLKIIGPYSFSINQINTITFHNSLEEIGELAFHSSGLKGKITIPNSVKTIGKNAFASVEGDCTGDENSQDYQNCSNMLTKLTEVTFEENSKIETIDEGAFMHNNITNITIPGSIKKIGTNAFNCPTLTSATIQRLQGSDLSVDSTAFGTLTPVYQQ